MVVNQGDLSLQYYKDQHNPFLLEYWFFPISEITPLTRLNTQPIAQYTSNFWSYLVDLNLMSNFSILKRGSWGWAAGSNLKLNFGSLSLKIPAGVVELNGSFILIESIAQNFHFTCLSF